MLCTQPGGPSQVHSKQLITQAAQTSALTSALLIFELGMNSEYLQVSTQQCVG